MREFLLLIITQFIEGVKAISREEALYNWLETSALIEQRKFFKQFEEFMGILLTLNPINAIVGFLEILSIFFDEHSFGLDGWYTQELITAFYFFHLSLKVAFKHFNLKFAYAQILEVSLWIHNLIQLFANRLESDIETAVFAFVAVELFLRLIGFTHLQPDSIFLFLSYF